MAEVYIKLVLAGKRMLASVPATFREEVARAVEAAGAANAEE